MNEYALLLFLLIGAGAAAVKTTGLSVREAFASSNVALGGEAPSERIELRVPQLRDGGMP